MLDSLASLERLKNGDTRVLRKEKWLMFLALTAERNVNLERLNSLDEIKNNYVMGYVERTLKALSGFQLDQYQAFLVETTLKWSEVAKAGLPHQRRKWTDKGINLFAHNIGSAGIFLEQAEELQPEAKRIVHDLISTHGLIGQYIRGEARLEDNRPLYRLVEEGRISAGDLKTVLHALNCCIISAVDERIWADTGKEADEIIDLIVNGKFDGQHTIKERIRRLRFESIKNGENFEDEFSRFFAWPDIHGRIAGMLERMDLWFVEAALYDFSFEEFIKIFLIISGAADLNKVRHLSFEHFMKDLYYQHEGKKRVNIYKKRIIEKYLSLVTLEEIMDGRLKESLHAVPEVMVHKDLDGTAFFNFRFSAAGGKLIDFCVEAEKSDVLYENAVLLLFDLFGLRKDKYDRFYEEESYLRTMNQTIDYKKVILDYITGDSILDIGPGGGALMDLIEDRFPGKKVTGVDIAQNVLDSLKKKKNLEKRKWDVVYGDALKLDQHVGKDQVDTIIFCSILHELFSYIEYEGRRFNQATLAAAFRSAFAALRAGGRIIIRDGIMTEPIDQKRIIRFLTNEGMEFLQRYAKDFKGREIRYTVLGRNEVLMPVNDAMEFLYTFTWGEKSYVHEVNEQFGYFTPGGFKSFIESVLGSRARIIELRHFLQEGYTIALSPRIEFFDESRKPVRLPDSTCIVVIEKIENR